MKFSYAILKKFVPDAPPIHELAEKITMHLFEVESAEGDILDIKILPNRYSDAACYRGLAREISALCNLPLQNIKIPKPKTTLKKAIPTSIGIPHLCRRIASCPVEKITIKESPPWLRNALTASGIRPINNLVDITNYVTLETGQPLHAFDFDKMQGGIVAVRQAREGEQVETLDRQIFELNPSALVLADERYALDIAGIKGGVRAEISAATKNILLTAANFDGVVIYKTSRRINLATDASVRFSHHLSPALVEHGMHRALALIAELCGGKIGIITDIYPKPIQPASIPYDHEQCRALTGLALSEQKALSLLKQLGFGIKGKTIQPPAERVDIEGPHDIAEEIARLYGYENIAGEAPRIEIAPIELNPLAICVDATRRALSTTLDEVYLPSFGRAGEVALENALSADRAYLRAFLAPELIAAAENNLRFFEQANIFEINAVFAKKATHEPMETRMLGIALSHARENQYALLRGIVEQWADALGLPITFKEESNGRLELYINDKHIGAVWIANRQTSVAEINLEQCAPYISQTPTYEEPSKYPAISRDLSLRLPKGTRIGKVIESIRTSAPLFLKNIDVVDSYQDSTTLRLLFQSPERTLTDDEVNKVTEKITHMLSSNHGIEIR